MNKKFSFIAFHKGWLYGVFFFLRDLDTEKGKLEIKRFFWKHNFPTLLVFAP